MRSLALKCDKDRIRTGVRRRRSADRSDRNDLGSKTVADAAEIVAIEQISARILAERKDERLDATDRRQIEQERIGAAEIGVAIIERAPVRGREETRWVVIMAQVGRQAENR